MYSRMIAILLSILLLLLSGCAKSPPNTLGSKGGVLAIPVRIHTEVKKDQFILFKGRKPYSFRIKISPFYMANGTVREKQAYDDFAFSEKLPAGIYEIEKYSFKSGSNTILTNAQNKMTDLAGENAIFKIEDNEITMLDKILQITGAHYHDRSLKHWNGENISSGAFEDFTTFLKPGDIDRSFRVWRWLDFKEGEFQRYKNMLDTEKTSDFWRKTLHQKEVLPPQENKQIGKFGDLIIYSNGTIEDTDDGLMWSVKDNGFDLNWTTANNYCEGLSLGGYTNWRLPTAKELTRFIEKQSPRRNNKIGAIETDEGVFLWTADTQIAPLTKIFSGAGLVSTTNGKVVYFHPADEKMNRVLPVRNVN